jgi:hypothetical protein
LQTLKQKIGTEPYNRVKNQEKGICREMQQEKSSNDVSVLKSYILMGYFRRGNLRLKAYVQVLKFFFSQKITI